MDPKNANANDDVQGPAQAPAGVGGSGTVKEPSKEAVKSTSDEKKPAASETKTAQKATEESPEPSQIMQQIKETVGFAVLGKKIKAGLTGPVPFGIKPFSFDDTLAPKDPAKPEEKQPPSASKKLNDLIATLDPKLKNEVETAFKNYAATVDSGKIDSIGGGVPDEKQFQASLESAKTALGEAKGKELSGLKNELLKNIKTHADDQQKKIDFQYAKLMNLERQREWLKKAHSGWSEQEIEAKAAKNLAWTKVGGPNKENKVSDVTLVGAEDYPKESENEPGTYTNPNIESGRRYDINIFKGKDGKLQGRPTDIPSNKEERIAAYMHTLDLLEPDIKKNGMIAYAPVNKDVPESALFKQANEFIDIAEKRGVPINMDEYFQKIEEKLQQPGLAGRSIAGQREGLESGILGKLGQVPVGQYNQDKLNALRLRHQQHNQKMGSKQAEERKQAGEAADKSLGIKEPAKKTPGESQISAGQKTSGSTLTAAMQTELTQEGIKQKAAGDAIDQVVSPPAPLGTGQKVVEETIYGITTAEAAKQREDASSKAQRVAEEKDNISYISKSGPGQ
jgi:hypothetical protein